MKINVLGLGYIGLPTAVLFASKGFDVHGVDGNPEIIESLRRKEINIKEKGLHELLIDVFNNQKIKFSTTPVESDVFIIAVPTPTNIDKTANLNYVLNAINSILKYLRKGNLIIIESTVPPGTIETKIIPLLESTKLSVGEDLFISHCPERILPGNLLQEMIKNDRVVGGINEISASMTVELYKCYSEGKIHVTDLTTAEMVKLMENAYRDVNIAFANEVARIAEKINVDIWEAIKIANSHPRVNILQPGPGVGGHCIAVDPYFLIQIAPKEAKVIAAARDTNNNTSNYIVELIKKSIEHIENPLISIFGLTYKAGVADIRESPAIKIVNSLLDQKYRLSIYDPLVNVYDKIQKPTVEEAANESDCLVFITDHAEFKRLDFSKIKERVRTKIIVDTRNVIKENITTDGFMHIRLGALKL
ncbi:nucleotide sugar dehydrogenase [Paenibacillus sp. 32O-W]|uniref:nucleotide sugar dehydrogenase n=1 Tax=Paenibacillus sp. 32O-W TaxID=1695218 RepID=UPI0011A35AF8|nr:nucleotide sugar dehydrogenase [Paenibacillus sp. 32O-W]